MDKQQLKAFRYDSHEKQNEMRRNGYMSSDIVAIAYFMIKDNIEDAEKLIKLDSDFLSLIERAEKILSE